MRQTIERLRVATYNVHKCRGLDGRLRPERVLAVLREINADVIALQEVLSIAGRRPELDQARFLAESLGYHHASGANRLVRGGNYGNVLLSRFPVEKARNYDLSVPGRERRGCLRADLDLGRRLLHVFNVHLGTWFIERRHQARRLAAPGLLGGRGWRGPRIVLGDFNEWTRGRVSRALEKVLGIPRARPLPSRRRTYPGLLPLLGLDRIYYDPELYLEQVVVHRSPTALIASDHLPLVAEFRI